MRINNFGIGAALVISFPARSLVTTTLPTHNTRTLSNTGCGLGQVVCFHSHRCAERNRNTLACRVGTHADAASALMPTHGGLRQHRRRDESRRGTHECVRHIYRPNTADTSTTTW